jgi:hypothetical protein
MRRLTARLLHRPSRRRGLLLLVLCTWLGLAVAADFRITQATTRLQNETYFLDVLVDYAFNDVVLEALDNGVPLTLDMHLQVRPRESWIWEDSVIDRHVRFSIRYQPLSGRYQVAVLPASYQKSFVTRDAAIAALGEIEGVPLVRRDELEPGQEYAVELKIFLDIEALPLPLRPLAYLRPSWNLSSGWTEWPLQP